MCLRAYLSSKSGNISILFVAILMWSCGGQSQKESTEEPSVAASQQEESTEEQPESEDPLILFFGNSITAGLGVDLEQAFPHLIQLRLDSLGYPYRVVNAGLSGETTSGGLNRIEWVMRSVPDIFILELGGNDGLRGIDVNESKKNLIGIIDKVRNANPDVHIILAGMMVPPNMGPDYSENFRQIFPAIAEEKDVDLIPFILEGVGGNPELNQSDGIHPTPEGHKIVADLVWAKLKPYLEKNPNL